MSVLRTQISDRHGRTWTWAVGRSSKNHTRQWCQLSPVSGCLGPRSYELRSANQPQPSVWVCVCCAAVLLGGAPAAGASELAAVRVMEVSRGTREPVSGVELETALLPERTTRHTTSRSPCRWRTRHKAPPPAWTGPCQGARCEMPLRGVRRGFARDTGPRFGAAELPQGDYCTYAVSTVLSLEPLLFTVPPLQFGL
jgi:hypothetical protein